MAFNLIEQLEKLEKSRTETSKILPLKDDILDAIGKGYTAKDILTILHNESITTMSYKTFTLIVRKWKKATTKTVAKTAPKRKGAIKVPRSEDEGTAKDSNKEDPDRKPGEIFRNWTGKPLSKKELYGIDGSEEMLETTTKT